MKRTKKERPPSDPKKRTEAPEEVPPSARISAANAHEEVPPIAPKGQKLLAQGNALGSRIFESSLALKGQKL